MIYLTDNNIDNIVSAIKITNDNTSYNVYNILKGIPDDVNWKKNRVKLVGTYNTILGMYLSHSLVRKFLNIPGYNPGLLKLSIDKYINKFNPPRPESGECCVYFRLGDILCDHDREDPTEFRYIEHISKHTHKIITIVANISFSSTRPRWSYNIHNVNTNRNRMFKIIKDINRAFPQSEIRVYSNDNADLDICYLYGSGFVGNPKSSWKSLFGRL